MVERSQERKNTIAGKSRNHGGKKRKRLTLHEPSQNPTPRLQQRVSHHNLQEPFQAPAPLLNHIVVEAVQVHFAGEGGDGDTRALALQQVAEDLEVRVAPPHFGAAQLEGRDVGREPDQVGCVARRGRGGWLVRLRVCDLFCGKVVL